MTAGEALAAALARIDRYDDPAVVIAVVPADVLAGLAAEIDAKPADEVPLRGLTFAVKDNIDVAGVATTAACPSFAYVPERSATVVDRLVQAGALPVVKTNLDQFATGLSGTRSPFGTPRNPYDPLLVPGGSSSGSAVAVATGLTDFALGTDTAGSGRVPAAMCGIVGVKPTPGWLSCRGVLPAVRSIDCVSVFATSVGRGVSIVELAAGFDALDPYARRRPQVASPPIRRLGVLADAARWIESPAVHADYVAILDRLDGLGFELVRVDPTDLFAIGDQLYGGPIVTERVAAFGSAFDSGASDLDPTVATILAGSARFDTTAVHRSRDELALLRHRVDALFDTIDALALPTIGKLVEIAEVESDPIDTVIRLGRFTTFTNLSGLCAITVPVAADVADRPPPSITLHAPGWSDAALAHASATIVGEAPPQGVPAGWIELAVAGAHLRGEVLDHQLTDRGAVFVETTVTEPCYRLFAMDTVPAKPALVHAGGRGASIEVDVWAVSPAALGSFVHAIPPPLCIGTVELAGGREVTGFVSEPRAVEGAVDITSFGGWRAYRAELARSGNGRPG